MRAGRGRPLPLHERGVAYEVNVVPDRLGDEGAACPISTG